MEDKTRSLAFLSLLCFGLADVRDGLGPFLGVYLQQQGWTADEIGIIMSLGDAVALLCAAPLGALTDHTRAKSLPLRIKNNCKQREFLGMAIARSVKG